MFLFFVCSAIRWLYYLYFSPRGRTDICQMNWIYEAHLCMCVLLVVSVVKVYVTEFVTVCCSAGGGNTALRFVQEAFFWASGLRLLPGSCGSYIWGWRDQKPLQGFLTDDVVLHCEAYWVLPFPRGHCLAAEPAKVAAQHLMPIEGCASPRCTLLAAGFVSMSSPRIQRNLLHVGNRIFFSFFWINRAALRYLHWSSLAF